jgi:hypothetical protein
LPTEAKDNDILSAGTYLKMRFIVMSTYIPPRPQNR